jgi:acetyl-CoA acetyltransferase
MPKTVILGSARTPIGKLGGGLSSGAATELGAAAITAALERADIAPDQVDHVTARMSDEIVSVTITAKWPTQPDTVVEVDEGPRGRGGGRGGGGVGGQGDAVILRVHGNGQS